MNKAIFFDRDGILTTEKIPPKDSKHIHINENIKEVLPHLKKMGYLLFCITNQPDVARGTKTKEEIQEVNDILWAMFPEIIKIESCIHDDQDNCVCRKPKSGMIICLAKEYEIDLSKSWVVGDTWKDIGAGMNAGTRTILLGKLKDDDKYIPDYSTTKIKNIIGIIEGDISD